MYILILSFRLWFQHLGIGDKESMGLHPVCLCLIKSSSNLVIFILSFSYRFHHKFWRQWNNILLFYKRKRKLSTSVLHLLSKIDLLLLWFAAKKKANFCENNLIFTILCAVTVLYDIYTFLIVLVTRMIMLKTNSRRPRNMHQGLHYRSQSPMPHLPVRNLQPIWMLLLKS